MNKYINMSFKSFVENDDGSKTYEVVAYTSETDRECEKATHEFLSEMAELIIDKPVTKNHDWEDVDNIIGRVVSSEIRTNEQDIEELWLVVNIKDSLAIEKIDKGLYKGVSVGFQCEKNENKYYTELTHCNDVYELSFVTVQCVPSAQIKIKSFKSGGKTMKGFKWHKLTNKYPELKSIDPEVLTELEEPEVEITEADIEELLAENEELKARCKELEEQVAEYKGLEEEQKNDEVLLNEISEAVDGLECTDDVKEVITEEAKEAAEKGDITVEENEVKGLDSFIDTVVKKYSKLGLIGTKSLEPETKVETKVPEFTPEQTEKKSVNVSNVHKVKKGFC